MKNNNSVQAYLLLSGTLLLCSGFAYWLVSDSEAEKVQNFQRKYELLLLQKKNEQAGQLFNDVLSKGGDAPLDEMWLPLVLMQQDGYGRLVNYTRILAGNPDREATYEEISNLMANAPEGFQSEPKALYLTELNDISGVRKDYLEKYKLLSE